jgi:hypothetical protein
MFKARAVPHDVHWLQWSRKPEGHHCWQPLLTHTGHLLCCAVLAAAAQDDYSYLAGLLTLHLHLIHPAELLKHYRLKRAALQLMQLLLQHAQSF